MKRLKISHLLFFTAILLGTSVAAMNINKAWRPIKKNIDIPAPRMQKQKDYDPKLLALFKKLFAKYDTLKANYTISGSITMQSKADTSANLNSVPFLMCKRGNDFYYRLGETETINTGGVYLYIDHKVRDVVLSAQKTVLFENNPQKLTGLDASLLSEGYALSAKIEGASETIMLRNPRHITCKEYAVTFDTSHLKVRKILLRLTDFQHPLDNENDKTVSLHLDKWDGSADLPHYIRLTDIIGRQGNRTQLRGRLTGYRMLRM